MIAMAVIGGMSSILGPLGGAFLFVGLRDVFLVGLGEELRWLALGCWSSSCWCSPATDCSVSSGVHSARGR